MFFGDIRPAWSHRYRSEARLTSGLVATCGSCTVGEFVESRNSAASMFHELRALESIARSALAPRWFVVEHVCP